MKWLDEEVTVEQAGGKNVSLSQMIRLKHPKIKVPYGFIWETFDTFQFLSVAGIYEEIKLLLESSESNQQLQENCNRAEQLVVSKHFSHQLFTQLVEYVIGISSFIGCDPCDFDLSSLSFFFKQFSSRSSCVSEDGSENTSAGQYESYLFLKGIYALCNGIVNCIRSSVAFRAVSYRVANNQPKFELMSVTIQILRDDVKTSGTLLTYGDHENYISIDAAPKAGSVVGGDLNPSNYRVHRQNLLEGRPSVLHIKKLQDDGLTEEQIEEICGVGLLIEELQYNGNWTDIEWFITHNGEIWITQSRPQIVLGGVIKSFQLLRQPSSQKVQLPETTIAADTLRGNSVATGQAFFLEHHDDAKAQAFPKGAILFSAITDIDWTPLMRRAGAIVSGFGGSTVHGFLVARELLIPGIAGTGMFSKAEFNKTFTDGEVVTVSVVNGVPAIFKGEIPYGVVETAIGNIPKTRTKIYANVLSPMSALGISQELPDGVGLLRAETVQEEILPIHHLAVLNPENLPPDEQIHLKSLIGNRNPVEFFETEYARAISLVAGSFSNKPVILRLLDAEPFKIRSWIGYSTFVREVRNPAMHPDRGAGYFCSPAFIEGYKLELRAIKKAREEFGFTNLIPMIPLVRSSEEGRRCSEVAREILGKNCFVYFMTEVPNNIFEIEFTPDNCYLNFCDGSELGTNDLDQFGKASDREGQLFEEAPSHGIIQAMCSAIRGCKARNIPIGTCGQAATIYSDVAEALIRAGIDVISTDSPLATRLMVAKIEVKLGIKTK